jgi:hypothetical protein
MAIEDLDLEFEEEDLEEKSDALEVDVDLSFSASNESSNVAAGSKSAGKPVSNISALDDTNPNIKLPPKQQPRAQAPTPQRMPTQQSQERVRAQGQPGKVQNIAEQRAKAQNQAQPQARVQSQQIPTANASFNEEYGLELQQLRDEIAELKSQIGAIQSQADVKVAVAEAKSEFVIDYVTDAKLVDHQVNQVLQRIHKRVPGLKNEVLSIKKTMTEFVEKTTKKKK